MTINLAVKIETWDQFIELVQESSKHLSDDYQARITFELYEINKQGLNSVWLEYVNNNAKFDANPNNLLVPWVLHMLVDAADPMASRQSVCLSSTNYAAVAAYNTKHGKLPHDLLKDADVPDIDIDCLPLARDPIKDYAIKRYGDGDSLADLQVCSVGTWQTYKFKMAIQDATTAFGYMGRKEIEKITAELPEDVDSLQTGGKAVCKGMITNENGELKECGNKHFRYTCPKCGSEITDFPTLARILKENELLSEFAGQYPAAVTFAVKMVGRIRSMGMHSGALIIANTKLLGHVPLSKNKLDGPWVSMWSEGGSAQLSKQGYIKWDILGLKTMEYIFNCCNMITANRGITWGRPLGSYRITTPDGIVHDLPAHTSVLYHGEHVQLNSIQPDRQLLYAPIIDDAIDVTHVNNTEFIPFIDSGHDLTNYKMSGLDDIDPELGYCGKFYDTHGCEHQIRYDDNAVYGLVNSQKTDTIFQFDTGLAKRILSDAAEGQGVHNPEILTLLNACGHPGPMSMIPKALENRDDDSGSWRQALRDIHPIMEEILSPTLGIIVYQEQLTALWQRLGGFSATEAQDARKDVAKKRLDKVAKIRARWITGATKTLGVEFATSYFDDVMAPFGRYAFNRCLSYNTMLCCIKTGITKTIQQWAGSTVKPWLWSYKDKQVVADECVDIHESGYLEIFEITFEDGRSERVTADHKFLCSDGQYHTVTDIIESDMDVITPHIPVSRLGNLQRLVLGLCTIHSNMSISKIAHELGRPRSQIIKVVQRLQDRGILLGLQPTSRFCNGK